MDELKLSFDYRSFLKTLTKRPGVYRMLNANQKVIYVGKARNLKNRVSSYFNRSNQTGKTQLMVRQIASIEISVTHTENEALILENNLIKDLKPQYNVLYRDDKSYPYIYLATSQTYPRLSYYRGARKEKGRYFGPYPSAGAARESLNLMQKLFPVRQCEDSFYNNRSRPCLQYQIKRCSGPCVGLITEEAYKEHVRHVIMFLEGKSSDVIDEQIRLMEVASGELDFEKAALIRDQISALRTVQEKQYVTAQPGKDMDIVAVMQHSGIFNVQVLFFRGGQYLGNKSFFPQHAQEAEAGEVLQAFLSQYYLGKTHSKTLPAELLLNRELADTEWFESVLSEVADRKIEIRHKVRGERQRWIDMAEQNANTALLARISGQKTLLERFADLQDVFQLESAPQRIECFDISHTMGEETVASCVVFNTEGELKSDYRLYNIRGITPGDDYAAMHQALLRRFSKARDEGGVLPDILLIDGGKGQLAQAEQALEALEIHSVILIGVAKGSERKAGEETLFLSGASQPFILGSSSPALLLIQQVRDEAHRFAITGHRARRNKKRQTSPLEAIPGLGPKRRQMLLRQFGGLQGVERAGVDDLANIKGISRDLAQKIYDCFHAEGS